MHWAVLFFKIDFPGYDHTPPAQLQSVLPMANKKYPNEKSRLLPIESGHVLNDHPDKNKNETPAWMYYFLAIPRCVCTRTTPPPPKLQHVAAFSFRSATKSAFPAVVFLILPAFPLFDSFCSIFDVLATGFCMMGLRYLDVSIYQLLRGSGIIFVALMKQHVLGDKLYTFQWIGVFWNVVSVVLVGATAVLNSSEHETKDPREAVLGVLLVLTGAFVQGLQYVFEEKVMADEEAAVPPLLLIGMEGLWGTAICLLVLYPVAYYLPGDDHGSYEDPFNTWHMVTHSTTIQIAFVIYFFVIFGYNLFAVLVTFLLNSVWHAILDNFRPITIWLTDLAIFYIITAGTFGEPWTVWSWIQLMGMFVLLYGTSVYNVPNAGSIRMTGEWWNFGIDMTSEYEALEVELEEKAEDLEWEQRQQEFRYRRPSSLAERSPMISIHTQALRGVGAQVM
jgi:drug/metabolite transporter (DMT)-like permease